MSKPILEPEQLRKDLAILGAVPSNQWVTARDISDRCGYSPKEVAWVLRMLNIMVERKRVSRNRGYRWLYKKRVPKPGFYLSP